MWTRQGNVGGALLRDVDQLRDRRRPWAQQQPHEFFGRDHLEHERLHF
jgi:hypothetical protein